MNRKRLALFILIVLFCLSLVFAVWRTPRLKTVSTLTYSAGTASNPRKGRVVTLAPPLDDKRVHLWLLARSSEGFKGFRRNIFNPILVDESKKVAKTKPVKLPPVTVPPPVIPPPPPPPMVIEPSPAQRELANFTFLGFLKKDGRKTIFLAKDKELFVVKKGDLLAGKYEAINITEDALTIKQRESKEEIVIPLQENRALNVPRQ